MLKSFYKFYILNGELRASEKYDPESICTGTSIYEVFRIIRGTPLFLGEHLDRLYRSAALLDREIDISSEDILQQVKWLSEANQVKLGNIEIIFNFCETPDQKPDFVMLFIEQRYPSDEQYRDGVGAISYDAVRIAPHVKQINLEMRQKTSSTIAENKLYEVILVNPDNHITEGSRSNVFFIEDETIFTPPVDLILPGITRDKIFKICMDNNINIREKNIRLREISNYDAAFISGTSPKILPLQFIDQVTFNTSNALMRKLIRAYDQMIEEHISKRESLFNQ